MCIGLAFLATPASAQPSIDAAMKRGVTLRREGRDAEALEVFRQILETTPNARARAQAGLAEQALSLWLAAEEDLALALADGADPWIRQNREALDQAMTLVNGKLAYLVVDVEGADGPVACRINGVARKPQLDGKYRIVAGQVTVEVQVEGAEPIVRTVQVAPEDTTTVSVSGRPTRDISPPAPPPTLPRLVLPPAPKPPAVAKRSGARSAIGWGALGVGAASLGVGVFFGVRALGLKSERDEGCVPTCSAAAVTADRNGRDAALVSTILTVAAVPVLAVGTWLLLGGKPTTTARTEVRLFGFGVGLTQQF